MTKCGICNCHSSLENPLFCASCVNFQLLKPKLEYLTLLNDLSSSKHLVDEVLDKCIKGNNYPFIKEFISSGGTNIPNSIDEHLSIGSIAALSSQLLTIDAMLMKKKNNKIMKEISLMKSKKDSNIIRLESAKKILNEKSKFQVTNDIDIKPIKEQSNSTRQKSQNIKKQINNSQSILFQELTNLYMVKKRKISGMGHHQHIFMISFIPIININSMISFNYEIINSSLERIAKFAHQISQIWFINLPFQFEFNAKDYFQPSILNFKLSVSKGQQIYELSTFELKLFLNGVSRLILNLYEILKFFELTEGLQYLNQLFKIDEMIYKIVNNNHEFKDVQESEDDELDEFDKVHSDLQRERIGETIDVDEFTEEIYVYILSKINQRKNEWHVVKKEFLIEEQI